MAAKTETTPSRAEEARELLDGLLPFTTFYKQAGIPPSSAYKMKREKQIRTITGIDGRDYITAAEQIRVLTGGGEAERQRRLRGVAKQAKSARRGKKS